MIKSTDFEEIMNFNRSYIYIAYHTYFLNNEISKIICKEYQRSSAHKIREKKYKVDKITTIMIKDQQEIILNQLVDRLKAQDQLS